MIEDDIHSWDILVPGRGWQYHNTVRESFADCGFSIRPCYSSRTGAAIGNRFTVDHSSPGAVSYWELRSGLVRFPDVVVREVVM